MADRNPRWLIRKTFRPLFWVLLGLYLSHRLVALLQIPRPEWVRNYLDDLLCLPLVLTVTLFIMRFFYGKQVRFNVYQVTFVVVYVGVLFELILPKYMPRYTFDWIDLGLYAVGGWVFYKFMNR